MRYMETRSIFDQMNLYVTAQKKDDVNYIASYLRCINSNLAKRGYEFFHLTPKQIGQSKVIYGNLRNSVHAFIKNLPFEERATAIHQFNEMFAVKNKPLYGTFLSPIHDWQEDDEREKVFCLIDKLYNRSEWEIILLKRLQMKEYDCLLKVHRIDEYNGNTPEEIEDELNFTRQTRQTKYKELQEEHDLLGSTIRINIENNVFYDDTVHPVFLALNAAEINFLTTVLRERFKGDSLENIAADIAYDVYRQLSEYGKSIVDRNAQKRDIDFYKGSTYKNSETAQEEVYTPRKGYRSADMHVFGIIEKRPCYCEIVLDTDMENTIRGRMERTQLNNYMLTEDDGRQHIFSSESKENEHKIKDIKFLGFAS